MSNTVLRIYVAGLCSLFFLFVACDGNTAGNAPSSGQPDLSAFKTHVAAEAARSETFMTKEFARDGGRVSVAVVNADRRNTDSVDFPIVFEATSRIQIHVNKDASDAIAFENYRRSQYVYESGQWREVRRFRKWTKDVLGKRPLGIEVEEPAGG